MFEFSNIKEYFNEILQENRKRTIYICGLLIFMTLCALVILLITQSNPKPKAVEEDVQRPLVLDESLTVPHAPIAGGNYVSSRDTKDKWSREEISKWFTLPSEEELQKLSKSNDKIVDDILGAAP